MSQTDKTGKTLTDADIITEHTGGRRGFLRLIAASGAVGAGSVMAPRMAVAQARDGDNGNWVDGAGCPRGPGGSSTGVTDADSGAISDRSGRGRGAPRC